MTTTTTTPTVESTEVMSPEANNRKEELELFGLLNDTEFKLKDIHSDWVLLTYDIPNTKEGSEVRRTFLNNARWLGAVQHTESVYMMPWTRGANNMIVKLQAVGEIFIFYTSVNPIQALDLTNKYDKQLQESIKSLEPRLDKMSSHSEEGHYGQVKRMSKITWERVNDLIMAAANRGSESLAKQLQVVILRLKTIDQSIDLMEGGE